MLLSAIDIGTNAVRLFFSYVFNQGEKVVVDKASLLRIPIRLGEDVFSLGYISEEKIEKLTKTMTAFKLLMDVYQPVAYKACATAAMREAQNRDDVIHNIAAATGLQIEIIDGLKEARLVSEFSQQFPGNKKYNMFVDVGGGSTEISLLQGSQLLASNSFKIGTVRLLKGQVLKEEWDKLKIWLKSLKVKKRELLMVGSGGNINKLTKLYGKLPENLLTTDRLAFGLADLSNRSLEERIQQMGLRPDRADVIVPAGHIFQVIMNHLKADAIYVPKIGLSDGIVSMLYREFSSLVT